MALQIADRVKETTQTTGTGALALAGAAKGYQAFSAVCSVNDTCYYGIEAVDSNGLPTGDWEVGLGTYSAANQLTRTTPQASSNAGSAVSFGAGTKGVWIDASATYLGLLQTIAGLASPPAIGNTTPAAGSFNPLTIGASGTQVILQCDTANQVYQRNGSNAQSYLLSGPGAYTDANNYERLALRTNLSGIPTLTTENAGTGSARSLGLGVGGVTKWTIEQITGHIKAITDNTQDIGASAASRPRNFYIGTDILPNTGASKLGGASNVWKQIYVDSTNTATVGNVTINKAAGRVILGAGGTTLTLTNSLITAASHVFLNSDGAPGNIVAVQFYAVPAAGSCTINAVPAVTNQTAIDFFVVNFD